VQRSEVLKDFRVFVACAGLGMGNASRTFGIIQALKALADSNGVKLQVMVITSGAGLKFLAAAKLSPGLEFDLYGIHDYYKPTWSTWPWALVIYLRNTLKIKKRIKQFAPDVILLDSDYHFLAYVGFNDITVSLGQASDVVSRAATQGFIPRGWQERINFFIRERMDAHVQSIFSRIVLVPCFAATGRQGNKIRIPLVVRAEFLNRSSSAGNKGSIGILLSGSNIEKDHFVELARLHGLEFISSRDNDGRPTRADRLDMYDIVITQGGLTSISECIARAKFMIVVPMTNHPEQLLNAREVERLGLGVSASLNDFEKFPQLLEKVQKKRAYQSEHIPNCTGAQKAAQFLTTLKTERQTDWSTDLPIQV
jgi:predicted glycosyltransferase